MDRCAVNLVPWNKSHPMGSRCVCVVLSAAEVLIQQNTDCLDTHMVSLIPESSPGFRRAKTHRTNSADPSEVLVLRNMMNSDNIMEPLSLHGSESTSQTTQFGLRPLMPYQLELGLMGRVREDQTPPHHQHVDKMEENLLSDINDIIRPKGNQRKYNGTYFTRWK